MNNWPKNTNPSKFLHDSGLLYRINREIMHPLGLALAVTYPDDMSKTEGTPAQVDVYACDDAEGIVFEEATMQRAQQRAQAYMAKEGQKRVLERQNKLGFVVQPLPKKTE